MIRDREAHMKTLDWKKLEKFIEERKPIEVSAGILDDWFWTAATVYKDGQWQDRDRAWVTSSWATPGFKAEMPNGDTIEVAASVEETEDQVKERKRKTEEGRRQMKEALAALNSQSEG